MEEDGWGEADESTGEEQEGWEEESEAVEGISAEGAAEEVGIGRAIG